MKKYYILASLVSLFNLIDGIATFCLVTRGLGKELNPLMALLIDISPHLFLWVKIGITPLFFLLAKSKDYRGSLWGCLVIFSLLTLYWLALLVFYLF
jgi:hypothetical protein